MGSAYRGADRAGEDFLTLDGKACKLDVFAHTDYDPDHKEWFEKRLKTRDGSHSVFCSCDLMYKSEHFLEDGANVNLLILQVN